MKKSIEVQKLSNPNYVLSIIKELLTKVGIEYGTISVKYKDELASVIYKKRDKVEHVRRLKPYKSIKMIYVDIDNWTGIPEEAYNKFYTRVGFLVLDNNLVNLGYDISATLLN